MATAIDCIDCPLRCRPLFVPMTPQELEFMRGFKAGERVVPTGSDIVVQGQTSSALYTVLEGMAVRAIHLPEGQRQVISFAFPGDFIGLQSGLMGEAHHSVTAITDMVLCHFPRNRVWDLFRNQPERAYDLTWIAAMEEHFLGETVATLGQRDATERVSWALVRIWRRLVALGMQVGDGVPFPFRQQDLADALGLSVVHTNRVLGQLRRAGLAQITARQLVMLDHVGLSRLAQLDVDREDIRPLI